MNCSLTSYLEQLDRESYPNDPFDGSKEEIEEAEQANQEKLGESPSKQTPDRSREEDLSDLPPPHNNSYSRNQEEHTAENQALFL